jgi:hypothetical protein
MKELIVQFIQQLCDAEKDKVKLNATLSKIAVYAQAILDAGDNVLGASIPVPTTGNAMLDMALASLPTVIAMLGTKVDVSAEIKSIIDFIAQIVNAAVTGLGISEALTKTVTAANELEDAIKGATVSPAIQQTLIKKSDALQSALQAHVTEVEQAAAATTTAKA